MAESKNLSQKAIAYKQGLKSEKQVLEDLSENYIFLFQRLRLKFAEIDLVFFDPKTEGIILVEVKTLGRRSFEEYRISKVQSRRLQRAQLFLIEDLACSVELRLAFVRDNGRVTYLNDFNI